MAKHELASRRSTLWTTILAVASGTILLSVVFLVLSIGSTRRIGEVTLAIRRLAAGDLSHVKIRSSREIEETAEAINQLAAVFRAQQTAGAMEKEREVRTERLAVVGRMASAVAHEIRNPLNSISLNIDVLADMLEKPENYTNKGRDVIRAVQREVDRLNEITEDYLQFGRMPRAMIGPCNVSLVVRETCDFMSGEFGERRVSVSIVSFDETAKVLSDEGQLRQALVNILRNAVEAMPDGGTIAIAIRAAAGDTIELSVTDSGQGIPAAQMARLFEPFATTKRGGTGLGLAFVQQVVTESGGKVAVESEEGRGTTVRIHLNRSAS
jgi:signal transduction histidine kinase